MNTKTLKLSFKDNQGKSKMVSINHPKSNLDDQTVKAQMEAMLNSKLLETKFSKVKSIKKAYMENKSREDFNLA